MTFLLFLVFETDLYLTSGFDQKESNSYEKQIESIGRGVPSGDELPCSGPIQWARGDVGLTPSAAARPWALAECEWRTAAPRLKLHCLPRA